MIPNDKLIQIADRLVGEQGLYSYQRTLLSSNKTEIIVNKSRQIGISYAVACWSLLQAIFNEKTELIISPSLRQSKHVMDYIYEHLNRLKADFTISLREETKTSIIFNSGGAIYSLPNSANTVRGFKADDIWIDEFAHFTDGTDKEIIEALAPSILRGGKLTLISTPFGDKNTFSDMWNNLNNKYKNLSRLKLNWRECPDMKGENLDRVHQLFPTEDAWNQEMEHAFLGDAEGQEFPIGLIQSCIDNELAYGDLNKDETYLGGADIGRERDLTAFVALSKENECYTLINTQTMRQTAYNEQLSFFDFQLANYKFDKFRIDESGIGNMLAEELARKHRIERITFNNENKQEMVGNLKRLMAEGKLKFPDDPILIDNIRAIRRKYSPSNYLIFEADRDPRIGHADLFWALCLALYDESIRKQAITLSGAKWR